VGPVLIVIRSVLDIAYSYSNNIVYNNFIWPEEVTSGQKRQIEKAAQEVLNIRAEFSDSNLADLYDPNTMPKALVVAHKDLDASVDSCYRVKPFASELERLQFLFGLYRKYTSPLLGKIKKKGKRTGK
jgi:hypothetical protein